MVREIMKDEAFLALPSERATAEDMDAARDLLETLEAHKAGCVGMAANMIGVRRRIIAFDNEGSYMVMFNPEIVKKSGAYEAEEGGLSLAGTRKTRRWQSIKVQYQNEKMQIRLKTFTGWTAQIISMKSITATALSYKRNEKGTPKACLFAFRRSLLLHFCLRQNRQDRRSQAPHQIL